MKRANRPVPTLIEAIAIHQTDRLELLQRGIDLAVQILHRDGIRPLEGQAFTQDEREALEALASE